MTKDNVIPFRKRPPTNAELEIFRQITRNWTPEMRELMFPDHARQDKAADTK